MTEEHDVSRAEGRVPLLARPAVFLRMLLPCTAGQASSGTQSQQPGKCHCVLWCGLVLGVVLVRGGVLVLPGALSDDPDGYRMLAENVVAHHCLGSGDNPTAYRPPLYPVLLAGCLALDPEGYVTIGLLHLATGLATVWLVWRLGVLWGLGRWAAVAAVLVAVDPILLVGSASVMTETVAALLTCLSLVCLTRVGERPTMGRVAVAGGCMALAILCRPTFLVWTAAVGFALAWIVGSRKVWKMGATAGLSSSVVDLSRENTAGQASSGTRDQPVGSSVGIRTFAVFVLSVVIVLAPWMVRNQIYFGRPVIGTTHGGYTLLLANNPSFYEYLGEGSWGSVWDASEFDREWGERMGDATPGDEVSRDRLAYSDGMRTIREQPRMFLYSCLVRMGRLWSPLPHQLSADETTARRLARYAVGAWYPVELSLAGVGLALVVLGRFGRRDACEKLEGGGGLSPSLALRVGVGCEWRGTWLWGLLLAGSFTAVHAVYWTNIRMRAPLMPVVALAATVAIMQLKTVLGGRNSAVHNEL